MGKTPLEVCEQCHRDIKGKMVACVFEGRILCLDCDKAARIEQRRQQRVIEKAAAEEERNRQAAASLWHPREFQTRVAGVTKHNDDGTPRYYYIQFLQEGQPVRLIREPYNVGSRFAVAVYWDHAQIGYLPDEVAQGVAPAMDVGVPASAWVLCLTGGSDEAPNVGVLLVVRMNC